jgi:hypothetical protein
VRLEPRQPLVGVREEAGLPLLPVGDHIHAVLGLLAHGIRHRPGDGVREVLPALAAAHLVEQRDRPREAAGVGGEDAIRAVLHQPQGIGCRGAPPASLDTDRLCPYDPRIGAPEGIT